MRTRDVLAAVVLLQERHALLAKKCKDKQGSLFDPTPKQIEREAWLREITSHVEGMGEKIRTLERAVVATAAAGKFNLADFERIHWKIEKKFSNLEEQIDLLDRF